MQNSAQESPRSSAQTASKEQDHKQKAAEATLVEQAGWETSVPSRGKLFQSRRRMLGDVDGEVHSHAHGAKSKLQSIQQYGWAVWYWSLQELAYMPAVTFPLVNLMFRDVGEVHVGCMV